MIELLVVVAIIVLMMMVALPSVSSFFRLSMNSAARDLSNAVKESFNAAVLTGRVYRIAYDLTENTYWVESGPPDVLLDTAASKEKEARRRKFGTEVKEKSPFAIDTAITRGKKKLPRGVVYEDVINAQSRDPIIGGITYTHFFPFAPTEPTIIHLKDSSNHHSSLVVPPLGSNPDLYDRYVNAKEAYGN